VPAVARALGVVESRWTYVVFPPIIFANLDPDGRCVRNSPLREGLSALGVWELPPPQEQVTEHIRDQVIENRLGPGGRTHSLRQAPQ
jgi:hypothetical protein